MTTCTYCGVEGPVEVEHVEPISRGGLDIPENRVPACFRCNRTKGSRFLLEWVWGIPKPKRPKGWRRKEGERLVALNRNISVADFAKAIGVPRDPARHLLRNCGGRKWNATGKAKVHF